MKEKKEKKRSNIILLIRCAVFLIVIGLIICFLQRIFGIDSKISYDHERGFLREAKDSMDAVYIGGSDVHAFWQPCFGWNEHGIAVWSFSTDSLPMSAVKYMLIEARKTQKNALYIISLSTFKKESTACVSADIHWAVDYLPFSVNKIRMIHCLAENTEQTGLEKLEYYFPIIRFHSRWDNLGKWVFGVIDEDYKASMSTDSFCRGVMDISDRYLLADGKDSLPEDVEKVFTDLLDYCDAEKIQVLFVKPPQVDTIDELRRMHSLEELISDRGYPFLDLMEDADFPYTLQTDFYNEAHTNVHGSLKYSRALSDYLIQHYSFIDKRGKAGWESWDKSAEQYRSFLSSFTLPIEWTTSPRDNSMSIPELAVIDSNGQSLNLLWSLSEGAEGYEIYRRLGEDHSWEKVAETTGNTSSWIDSSLEIELTYSYTVIPYKYLSGERVYGSFDVIGVSGRIGDRT